MKPYLLLFSQQFLSLFILAQNKYIKGYVYEDKQSLSALYGANIYTLDKKIGTVSDQNGYFFLEVPFSYDSLEVSYIGFENQVVYINENQTVKIILKAKALEEVEVRYKKLDRSYLDAKNTQTIDAKELTKAACCNISESFETNATVDVGFSDAISGAKHIKMLGLDGFYTQSLFENQPGLRGIGNSFGILYVPGPFLNSIQLNKGSGSVVNGYESITGQINYNYKESDNSERYFLNFYGSRHGQFEINTNVSHRFNHKLSTIFLVHGTLHEFKHDDNNDGFQEVPINERIVASNKWKYNSDKGFATQFGFHYVYDQRKAGQFEHFKVNKGKELLYKAKHINKKYEAFLKTGFILKNQTQSIGIQYQYKNQQQLAWYGKRSYNALENFGYTNFIFQTKMKNTFNTMKLGASYQLDFFKEQIDSLKLSRKELVPGVFAEYSFQDNEKLSVVLGMRADYHNLYGVWLNPRFNFKYTFPKRFTLKIALGKGNRVANIIAENIGLLASSRAIHIETKQFNESAWNVGGSLAKEIYLGFVPASIVIDFYHTLFTKQIIADFEKTQEVYFYTLNGKSYSNSFQVETKVEPVEGLDLQLAYKFDDVNIEYKSGLKRAPYIPRHKLLFTADYETPNEKWRFNITTQLFSKSRIPSTSNNPEQYQRQEESKMYVNLNSNINIVVKRWELYVGAENILNFWQKNPIIAADKPFGNFFDASMVWGPLGGVRLYAGFRLKIPYSNKIENANFIIK